MILISLQSGSSGNCIYVESGDVRLLFDAGLSASQVEERLRLYGRDPRTIQGLFLSHNHSDHVRCAGIYTRKFGLPIFTTEATFSASRKLIAPGKETQFQSFRSGESVKIGHVTVETVGTPHDAVDGVIFVVDDGRHRLGICTDFGHVFKDLKSLVKSVDGLFLESNFDEKMLKDGSYPARLKARISGPGGHISNREAAELVESSASHKLQWLCLAHLSQQNNTPEKALKMHREVLGKELPIQVTSRYHATEKMVLGETPIVPYVTHQLVLNL